MKTELIQKFKIDENGNAILVSEETVEIPSPSIEDKEAELLALYDEIQALKQEQA